MLFRLLCKLGLHVKTLSSLNGTVDFYCLRCHPDAKPLNVRI